ncbi:hypothetical protein DIU31_016185 [Mucilaginibacter rubeus]|uniref:Uncharacterized protein n=1 Tax=Mucilaginibacter rubeus TaxID=2027860 RepID=A0AAE6JFU7_9SPHI|nr:MULTISPECIES: hypothetical protein [Mucilaginibacter]QEM04977.1 hypothetical protein DIU31_016185 [Mucilaginibacter rubeus]QEM17571.1 hypothetical protein DIU38_016350 [Mucilaginibacter gossypii]QTE45908.1 hypothetical protein J3L19_11335 [Mucilaginibacter rubeus]QTE52505.1 hypothetical protein J3L21_11305 [Mucilaginibacter rubeus]QTE57594.1 hypothetical protein J3L23_02980 [Mucilaginibacter rubeus]
MDNYAIMVSTDKGVHHFEVGEYVHHDDTKCKYKVFENGVMIASFEPDHHDFLHICQNPGEVNEEILHLLADQIEKHHPQGKFDNPQKHIL